MALRNLLSDPHILLAAGPLLVGFIAQQVYVTYKIAETSKEFETLRGNIKSETEVLRSNIKSETEILRGNIKSDNELRDKMFDDRINCQILAHENRENKELLAIHKEIVEIKTMLRATDRGEKLGVFPS